MRNETPHPYRLCPVPGCLEMFDKYISAKPEDAVLVSEFRQLPFTGIIRHPRWSSVDLAGDVERVLREDKLRLYLSKLERLAQQKASVNISELLPFYEDRHPYICSAFPIEGTMFSLHLQKTTRLFNSTDIGYWVSLLGIGTWDQEVTSNNLLYRIAGFSLQGKAPDHI